jgi:hypothetical protein
MDGGMKVAIQLKDVQLLVVLELVGAVLGDFNNRTKYFGRAIANGQLKVIHHFLALLYGGSGSATRIWMPATAGNRGVDQGPMLDARKTGRAAICPQARPRGPQGAYRI